MSSTTITAKTYKILAILLATVTILSAAPSAGEKHISVFSPVATYTLPVQDRAGHEYAGLLELLEPLGRVSSETDGRRWKLRYNSIEAEFTAGKTRAKIRGHNLDLSAPFLMENSRGLVPLSSVSALLARFLETPVNYRESARRLFVGDVGIQTSFHLDTSNPPQLALNFSAPVNPTISTEAGKLRMVFTRDPVVSPGNQITTFASKVIIEASYSENNGDAELDIAASEPLMASFSDDRKTITVSVLPSATTPTIAGPQNPAQTTGTTIATGIHRVLAVVDAAHGGDERGAALSATLAEKDVTLGFARLLRHELEIRGFAVALLRDSDTSSTLDQRAATANVARAGIYISLHAVSQGSGVRVYTALLPVEGTSKGIFHAWNAAQAQALPVSRMIASAIVVEMQKKEFRARASSASLRPLNNVTMPAVAVELAPGENGAADLISANYQQRAAAAIADAVASLRDRLGVQP